VTDYKKVNLFEVRFFMPWQPFFGDYTTGYGIKTRGIFHISRNYFKYLNPDHLYKKVYLLIIRIKRGMVKYVPQI